MTTDPDTSSLLPEKTVEPLTPAAPPPALLAAPQAVKRSMPMALSITLGILAAAFFGWFFYTLTWFILLLYLSFIIATILEAPVHWATSRGVNRYLATIILMVGLLLLIAAVVYLLANQIYNQISALSSSLEKTPDAIKTYLNHIAERYPRLASPLHNVDLSAKISAAFPAWTQLLSHALNGFETLTYSVVAFFIVMYMVIEGPSHLKSARRLIPKENRLQATRVFEDMAKAHRGWFLASAANITSASLLTTIGLYLTGVPGALILGLIAGLGELVPNVGPFFGAIPALVVALFLLPSHFPYVVLMFIIVQTIQGYGISPQVMKFGVRLPVLALIISVLVMTTLFGVLGVLIAIPLTADMVVLWNYANDLLEKDPIDSDTTNTQPAPIRTSPRYRPKSTPRDTPPLKSPPPTPTEIRS